MNKAHEVSRSPKAPVPTTDYPMSVGVQSKNGEMIPSRASGWYPKNQCAKLVASQADVGSIISISGWTRHGVIVISGLELAEAPDGTKEVIRQWHVSISRDGNRPTDAQARAALACFGMTGAEEDNHHPGGARHFWMPVDPTRRVSCECKSDETLVEEPDGYRWSKAKDGPCAYCEMIAIGRTDVTCPDHPA